jgi:pimeloyl-ACP methyl ester carboxylesterase
MNTEAILIHGWDPKYYNSKLSETPDEGLAWSHRPELVHLLSERFDLRYYNLPGFVGNSESEAKLFDVEDFAKSFKAWNDTECPNPALVIGYSFGGAVALVHKVLTQDPTPTVLISPALFRGEGLRSEVAHKIKGAIPEMWTSHFRHLYQTIASRYYREGTPFLRQSYNTIVRRDLRPLLNQVDPGGLLLMYGEHDSDTPWELVRDEVIRLGLSHHVVADGAHTIGQTSPLEIVERIDSFLHHRWG